jgi:beta-mannosidase
VARRRVAPTYPRCLYADAMDRTSPLLLLLVASTLRCPRSSRADTAWNSPSLDSLPRGRIIDLGGSAWTVSAIAGPGAANCSAPIEASVPGDIYTDLHRAGVIGDPLAAFGDWKTAWAGRTSWKYSHTFSLSAAQLATSAETLVVAEGIETNASVVLNGRKVLAADDSWITYTRAVQPLLRAGNNTLEVVFTSVYDACEFSNPWRANVTCPGRVYVRQAASSWGWDWAKRYSPQGIWRPVYLAMLPPAAAAAPSATIITRREHAAAAPPAATAAIITAVAAIVSPAPGQLAQAVDFEVDVHISVYACAQMRAVVKVNGDWMGGNVAASNSSTVSLQPGENTVNVRLAANGVKLWWPTGYGGQAMYNLTAVIAATATSMTRLIGFRTVRLQTDGGVAKAGGSSGSGNASMIVLVNGRKILARGSSLVPLDTFNGEPNGHHIEAPCSPFTTDCQWC